MGRLHRGLWQVLARFEDHYEVAPREFALPYDDAARLAPVLGEEGAKSAVLIRVPGTRARWEYVAPYEASDKPQW